MCRVGAVKLIMLVQTLTAGIVVPYMLFTGGALSGSEELRQFFGLGISTMGSMITISGLLCVMWRSYTPYRARARASCVQSSDATTRLPAMAAARG